MDFDVIPFEDITWGERLGGGSFGSVYKGTYLGIDIAIKEVLPSTEYDVRKYFEREWRIMRECRHPNIVLFLGLSRAPEEDGRVFIISEYIPRGNLRQFILSSRPFPWRLRLSYATDVARAVAYLHARKCIHRDLKGENLLITSNDRIKVTDFGFARIASRNADEMRRMTYCGTDGYMSPEIINGLDFDLPTDVFSLGIIFIEIMSRKCVDSKTYVRLAPEFTPDEAEVRRRASPGCPAALIDLALACCKEEPSQRPSMQDVLGRLREIELEVMSRLPDEDSEHVGSIKLVNHGGKRAMPSFEPPTKDAAETASETVETTATEEADQRMEEDALVALGALTIDGSGASGIDGQQTWRTAHWVEKESEISKYTLASEMRADHGRDRASSDAVSSAGAMSLGGDTGLPESAPQNSASHDTRLQEDDGAASAITLRQATPPEAISSVTEEPDTVVVATAANAVTETPAPLSTDEEAPRAPEPMESSSEKGGRILVSKTTTEVGSDRADESMGIESGEEVAQVDTAQTFPVSEEQPKQKSHATEGAMPSGPGTHRFTLVDRDPIILANGKKASGSFAFAFLPKALGSSSKCSVCVKRLGQRPALQCDDCQALVHVKCSHAAPRNCSGVESVL